MGNPILKEIWVDPVNGNDINQGNNATYALKSFSEAWNRIPESLVLTKTGYLIMLMPGNYDESNLPVNGWLESRLGTYNYPIIIQSAYKDQTVSLKTADILNFYNCSYLYLMNLDLSSSANNVLHLEKCDHILMKNLKITGLGNLSEYTSPQEDLKANQCKNIYLEGCDISNAWNVPVDFVAVENGHITDCKIHQAGDWCIYLKGGSSHFVISRNEIYEAVNGGFTAGQGTGFEWMEPPYIHYEVYDIKFVNNIIHDTHGAGMGVNGGYNILLAYNTLYRVGDLSHALEFVHGVRICGDIIKGKNYLSLGGWGTTNPSEQLIPNKNVYVYNNILFNPDGFQSQWSQFAVDGPFIPDTGSNIPSPSLADDNLQIKGNIIWNGPTDLPLGIEEVVTSLSISQIISQNMINTLKPQLMDPDNGDFRPVPGGNLYSYTAYPVPDFPGEEYPTRPLVEPGNLNNTVNTDYELNYRAESDIPGVYASPEKEPLNVDNIIPQNGAIGVSVTLPITLTFNKNIKTGPKFSGIYIKDIVSGALINITSKTIKGSTLILNHTNLLNKTTYRVYLPEGAVTDASSSDASEYSFSFQTVAAPIVNKPPAVIKTTPARNATGVSLTSPITIYFSEKIRPGANFAKIYIKNLNTGKTVSLSSKTINGSTLTIKMARSRLSKNTYQVYLPAGSVKDLKGKNLATSYTLKFKTV